jgi:hypothetical protein
LGWFREQEATIRSTAPQLMASKSDFHFSRKVQSKGIFPHYIH